MNTIRVGIGEEMFAARLQDELAPNTCSRFRELLPWTERIIHTRWSGEGCWIPLGNLDMGIGFESATSHPQPGEFILYPGGESETEILLAYGTVCFASKAGLLAGNPFLRIIEKLPQLEAIGRDVLWSGSRQITFW